MKQSQDLSQEEYEDSRRRQLEHDAKCDCNYVTIIATGQRMRYPNVMGGHLRSPSGRYRDGEL